MYRRGFRVELRAKPVSMNVGRHIMINADCSTTQLTEARLAKIVDWRHYDNSKLRFLLLVEHVAQTYV
jgi:hypothetical protein